MIAQQMAAAVRFAAYMAKTSLVATLAFAAAGPAMAIDMFATTSGGAWRNSVEVKVRSAEPVADSRDPLVRRPILVGVPLPASALTRLLSRETGAIYFSAEAHVIVDADDAVSRCLPGTATIQRGSGRAQEPPVPMSVNVCAALVTGVEFVHAVGLSGKPIASAAVVTVSYSHTNEQPLLVSPGPPPRTSGHVLSSTGSWADDPFWMKTPDPFVLAAPNWIEALAGYQSGRHTGRVGVTLKLIAKNGLGSVGSCEISVSSGDTRLDAATCKAFLSTSYSELQGRAFNGTYDAGYPVIVKWHGGGADMVAPALPVVPYMPRDIPLMLTDKPLGNPPSRQTVPMRVSLAPDGHATGCLVLRSSGNDRWDAAGCRVALQRAHFTAPVDAFGRPAEGSYDVEADWVAMTVRPTNP